MSEAHAERGGSGGRSAPGQGSELLLSVEGLRAGFGSNAVLHGVTFGVRPGEVAAVLGLNGAGKSVTLKVVGGVVPAWGGRIVLAGEDVTALDAEARVARGMAHVPQGRQVFPDLTVEQNLRLGGYTLRRRSKARYGELVDALFERFGVLADRRTQPAGTLSGGEQAMLAMSRALASDPKLVLVDEASAGLAPVMVRQLFEMLREVNRSGVTLLVVEQNVTFTLQIADRAHIMQRGQIVYESDVGALDQKKVATYLGVGRLLGGGIAKVAASRKKAPPTKPGKPRKRAPSKRKTSRRA